MRNEPIYMGARTYWGTLYRCRLSHHAMLYRSVTDHDDVYNNNIFVCAPPAALWQGGAEMITMILDLFAACMMPGGSLAYGATIAGLMIIALFLGLIDGGYND